MNSLNTSSIKQIQIHNVLDNLNDNIIYSLTNTAFITLSFTYALVQYEQSDNIFSGQFKKKN